mgnify:CR=1 FL=1
MNTHAYSTHVFNVCTLSHSLRVRPTHPQIDDPLRFLILSFLLLSSDQQSPTHRIIHHIARLVLADMAIAHQCLEASLTSLNNGIFTKPQIGSSAGGFSVRNRKTNMKNLVYGKPSYKTFDGARKTSPRLPFAVKASTQTGEKLEQLVLQPVKEINGTLKLPGSKSLSNRILLLAALAEVSHNQALGCNIYACMYVYVLKSLCVMCVFVVFLSKLYFSCAQKVNNRQ